MKCHPLSSSTTSFVRLLSGSGILLHDASISIVNAKSPTIFVNGEAVSGAKGDGAEGEAVHPTEALNSNQ
jgi:hypothetical protein